MKSTIIDAIASILINVSFIIMLTLNTFMFAIFFIKRNSIINERRFISMASDNAIIIGYPPIKISFHIISWLFLSFSLTFKANDVYNTLSLSLLRIQITGSTFHSAFAK